MSLKVIHVLVILASISLLDFFGVWLFLREAAGAAYASWILSGILCIYLVWFIRKLGKK